MEKQRERERVVHEYLLLTVTLLCSVNSIGTREVTISVLGLTGTPTKAGR